MEKQKWTHIQSSELKLTSSRKLFSLRCLLFNLPFHLCYFLYFITQHDCSDFLCRMLIPQFPCTHNDPFSSGTEHCGTSHFTYSRHTQLQDLWGPLFTSLLSICPSSSQATYLCVLTSTCERRQQPCWQCSRYLCSAMATPQWGKAPVWAESREVMKACQSFLFSSRWWALMWISLKDHCFPQHVGSINSYTEVMLQDSVLFVRSCECKCNLSLLLYEKHGH